MDKSLDQELLEAKGRLYGLLLQKGGNNWTDSETDIAFHLSMDPQIQDALEQKLRPTEA